LIDRREGGWHPQLDDSLTPVAGYFVGKPDLYHALQACLIPLYPTDGSLNARDSAGKPRPVMSSRTQAALFVVHRATSRR